MNTLQRIANRSLDYLLFNRFLEPYWLNKMRGKVLCLLYHRVDSTGQYSFLAEGGIPTIYPDELESDLSFLLDRGCHFLTFKDLHEGKFPTPDEIAIAVTFDDGFVDNYTIALGVLDRLGIRATIFQSTAMIDSDVLLWEHGLYFYLNDGGQQSIIIDKLLERNAVDSDSLNAYAGLKLASFLRENVSASLLTEILDEALSESDDCEQRQLAREIYPNTAQVRKAHEVGHIIGSHGHHHYKRENITAKEFAEELVLSKNKLRIITGEEPFCFSYPFNSYEPGDKEICEKYFQQVATVDGGFIEDGYDQYEINRVTWPGKAKNEFRKRRWLTTGQI